MRKIIISVLLVLLPVLSFAGGQATSGVTAGGITDRVREILAERTGSATTLYYTDLEIRSHANYAVFDISARTHCLQDTAAIALAVSGVSTSGGTVYSGTTEYAWTGASDYMMIETVMYFNSNSLKYKGLIKTDIKSIGSLEDKGAPAYWYEWDDKIGIWPTATLPYSGQSVYVYYNPMPDGLLSSTSPVETPSIYDSAIIDYAVSQMLLKKKRYQEADFYNKRYEARLDRYRVDLVDKPRESIKDLQP